VVTAGAQWLVPFPVTAREGRPTDSHSSRVDLAAEGCARLPQGELDHLAFVRLPCFLARLEPYSLQSGASAQAVRRARLRENLCRRCERKPAVAGGRAEEPGTACVRARTRAREFCLHALGTAIVMLAMVAAAAGVSVSQIANAGRSVRVAVMGARCHVGMSHGRCMVPGMVALLLQVCVPHDVVPHALGDAGG
jgi:hypothetical protein